uniref:Uncharacterized protein n=1 Tax=Cucumis melo TaxID=3656 RepID=A0A9I9E3P8_CUCME
RQLGGRSTTGESPAGGLRQLVLLHAAEGDGLTAEDDLKPRGDSKWMVAAAVRFRRRRRRRWRRNRR